MVWLAAAAPLEPSQVQLYLFLDLTEFFNNSLWILSESWLLSKCSNWRSDLVGVSSERQCESETSLALLGPPESSEHALALALWHLGQLPLPELVAVDEEGGEVEDQAVSHVDNAQHLDNEENASVQCIYRYNFLTTGTIQFFSSWKVLAVVCLSDGSSDK